MRRLFQKASPQLRRTTTSASPWRPFSSTWAPATKEIQPEPGLLPAQRTAAASLTTAVQRLALEDQAVPETGVEERFASHTLTPEDLTDPYVVEQFQGMEMQALFEYRRAVTDETVRAHILMLVDSRERDPYLSYLGKSFTIESATAVIRDRDGTRQVYVEGDEIPEGKAVGDAKTIPAGTSVYITDITEDLRYVQAEDWGWTAIGNIAGGMYNETLGIDRAEQESDDASHKTVAVHDSAIRSNAAQITYPEVQPPSIIPKGTMVEVLEQTDADGGNSQVRLPDGSVVWTRSANLAGQAGPDGTFEVTDSKARIRSRLVTYPATGGDLPQGHRVIVLAQSPDTDPVGKYVQVTHTKQNEAGERVRDEDQAPVWTLAASLADGWADFKSDNARWRGSQTSSQHGVYLGQMDVVEMVGRNIYTDTQELERLSTEMLDHYNQLVAAAASDGHTIKLNSGFRTFPQQQELWNANPNTAEVARPGRSNHQNGIAIDITVAGFTSPVYEWMKVHGPEHGFIRTVNDEPWHWEYRPDDAATHGYKLPSVSP